MQCHRKILILSTKLEKSFCNKHLYFLTYYMKINLRIILYGIVLFLKHQPRPFSFAQKVDNLFKKSVELSSQRRCNLNWMAPIVFFYFTLFFCAFESSEQQKKGFSRFCWFITLFLPERKVKCKAIPHLNYLGTFEFVIKFQLVWQLLAERTSPNFILYFTFGRIHFQLKFTFKWSNQGLFLSE